MSAYVVPQVQVFQEFRQIPTTAVANLNAFVFGPHYSLFRHSVASEKQLIGVGALNPSAGGAYPWPNKAVDTVTDQNYAKLFAEKAELQYFAAPASPANPVFVTTASDRTKLRASPRLTDGGVFPADSDVTISYGGMHTGKTDLPEAYYFVPTEDFQIGGASPADGELTYITSKGFSGTVSVPDTAASGAGFGQVSVAGPDGVAMDFDAGNTADPVLSPRVITFTTDSAKVDGAYVNYFTLSVLPSALAEYIDNALNSAANSLAVAYDYADDHVLDAVFDGKLLAITVDAEDTLSDVRSKLISLSGTADSVFSISALSGSGAGKVVKAKDQADSAVAATAIKMIPNAWKVIVHANSLVFKTENGFDRSAALGKDVEIGDKIEWSSSDADGNDVSGKATIRALVADMSAPITGPSVAASEFASSYGVDFTNGVKAVSVIPGSDNSAGMQGVNTTVAQADVLFGGVILEERIPSYAAGVIAETVTATVVRTGYKYDPALPTRAVALFRVESSSGGYYKTGERLQNSTNDGKLYIGNNLCIEFDSDTASGLFTYGDTYTVAIQNLDGTMSPVPSSWRPAEQVFSAGTYTGNIDTEYSVEVVRGGLFEPAARAIALMTATAGTRLEASLGTWTGGDVDDEYRLICMTAGNAASATFHLASQLSDSDESVVFGGVGEGNAVKVGRRGLQLYFTDDAAFVAGAEWTVLVRASRPRVKVSDSAGTVQEMLFTVSPDDAIMVGFDGVMLTIPDNGNNMAGLSTKGGLLTGERFTILATATKAGPVKTLVLSDELPATLACGVTTAGLPVKEPSLVAFTLNLVENSVMIPKENHDPAVAAGQYNFTTSADFVTVAPMSAGASVQMAAGIKVQNPRVTMNGSLPYLELRAGNLFIEHRDLLKTHTASISSISDIGLVASTLGDLHPDNPLALGVHKAMQNCGSATLYYCAVESDDQAGYLKVLSKASLTSNVYAFCPLTLDTVVHQDVQAHIEDMSSEINKRWRVAFVGTEMPSELPVVYSGTSPDGHNWTATIARDTRPGKHGAITKVSMLSANAELLSILSVGDHARLQFSTDAWGVLNYTEVAIAEVESNSVFYVATPLPVVASVPQRVEIWHPLTTPEVAQEVSDISSRYGSRRMYHVFPGQLESGEIGSADGLVLPAFYGAAAVAGLCSSVVPQQGLTNIELNGFSNIPVSYGVFSYTDLNTIASGGTLIVMQETRNSAIFIRHQISTAYADGNLNTSELSITKNLDAISYYFAGVLRPYIGRYNITPELLMVLRNEVINGLSYLGAFTSVGLLGPQLILENGKSKIRTLQQHPTLKDRVYAVVDLEMPYPLNVIELHLVV
jgi:hypothetical protein